MLVVGYYSTPSNSTPGKIAFVGVIIMVAGIAFKVLHLNYADGMIYTGLAILVATYAIVWFSKNNAK